MIQTENVRFLIQKPKPNEFLIILIFFLNDAVWISKPTILLGEKSLANIRIMWAKRVWLERFISTLKSNILLEIIF